MTTVLSDTVNTTKVVRSASEEKALNLLGTGLSAEIVASAIGVSPSRISQLLADPEFATAVTELRYQSLQKHNIRDSNYDTLEDKALKQLESSMVMVHRPMELLKIVSVLNAAKRRGHTTPDSIANNRAVVTINMPTKIIHQFTTNINNQVISAGQQQLLTIQSDAMKGLASKLLPAPDPVKELENEKR